MRQSGSSCFCAAVADAVETTMETAVAASKLKSILTAHHLYDKKPGAAIPPVFLFILNSNSDKSYNKSILANVIRFYFSIIYFYTNTIRFYFSYFYFH